MARSMARRRPTKPYEWRHGFIPRTPGAALSKAKGDRETASKLSTRYNVSGAQRAVARASTGRKSPSAPSAGSDLRRQARAASEPSTARALRADARSADRAEAGQTPAVKELAATAARLQRKTPKERAPGEARRGDLVVVSTKRSGFGTGQGPTEDHHVGIATKVDRNGVVQEAKVLTFTSVGTEKIAPGRQTVRVVGDASTVDIPGALQAATKSNYGNVGKPDQVKGFDSLDAVRAAVGPHRKAQGSGAGRSAQERDIARQTRDAQELARGKAKRAMTDLGGTRNMGSKSNADLLAAADAKRTKPLSTTTKARQELAEKGGRGFARDVSRGSTVTLPDGRKVTVFDIGVDRDRNTATIFPTQRDIDAGAPRKITVAGNDVVKVEPKGSAPSRVPSPITDGTNRRVPAPVEDAHIRQTNAVAREHKLPFRQGDTVNVRGVQGNDLGSGKLHGLSADGKYADVIYGSHTTPRRVAVNYIRPAGLAARPGAAERKDRIADVDTSELRSRLTQSRTRGAERDAIVAELARRERAAPGPRDINGTRTGGSRSQADLLREADAKRSERIAATGSPNLQPSPQQRAVTDARSMTPEQKIRAAEIMYGTGSPEHQRAKAQFGGADPKADARAARAAEQSQRAAELRAKAAAERAKLQGIADNAGVGRLGITDPQANRLSGRGLAQAHRNTDSSLRRFTETRKRADRLEGQANVAEFRAKEAARTRLTRADVEGATHIVDQHGQAREVVRVNAKTVTVKTPYSWTETVPIDKIRRAIKATPEQIAEAKRRAAARR